MELCSLPSLCTRRSFTIAHKSCVAACRISARLSPTPHPAQWQLAIKRHQESKQRKTWLELGAGRGGRLVREKGMCRRRLVALACAFQGDALTQTASDESRSFT